MYKKIIQEPSIRYKEVKQLLHELEPGISLGSKEDKKLNLKIIENHLGKFMDLTINSSTNKLEISNKELEIKGKLDYLTHKLPLNKDEFDYFSLQYGWKRANYIFNTNKEITLQLKDKHVSNILITYFNAIYKKISLNSSNNKKIFKNKKYASKKTMFLVSNPIISHTSSKVKIYYFFLLKFKKTKFYKSLYSILQTRLDKDNRTFVKSTVGYHNANVELAWNKLFFLSDRSINERSNNIFDANRISLNNIQTLDINTNDNNNDNNNNNDNDYRELNNYLNMYGFVNNIIRSKKDLKEFIITLIKKHYSKEEGFKGLTSVLKYVQLQADINTNNKDIVYLSDLLEKVYNNPYENEHYNPYKVKDNKDYIINTNDKSVTNRRVELIGVKLNYGYLHGELLSKILRTSLLQRRLGKTLLKLVNRMSFLNSLTKIKERTRLYKNNDLHKKATMIINSKINPNVQSLDTLSELYFNREDSQDRLGILNLTGLQIKVGGRWSARLKTKRAEYTFGKKAGNSNLNQALLYTTASPFLNGKHPEIIDTHHQIAFNKNGISNIKVSLLAG